MPELYEDITSDTSLPYETDVISEDGEEAASDNLAQVIGGVLGKEFPNDETALKAIKDTFDYVGKAGQAEKELVQVKAELMAMRTANSGDALTKLAGLEKTINDDKFYNQKPEYAPHRELISKFGDEPAKVVETESFKQLFTTIEAGTRAERAKSVLTSNPRLGQISDKMSQAREEVVKAARAAQAGEFGAQALDESARTKAVESVMEAYDLK